MTKPTDAAKDDGETTMHIRCTKAEKAWWVAMAQRSPDKTLSEYVKKRLPPPPSKRQTSITRT